MGITATIRDRLIAIERTMQYGGASVNASAFVPKDIQAFQLPLFINFPPSGSQVQIADTGFNRQRTWIILLIIRKAGDGGQSENELMALDMVDLVYELFLPRQRLQLNDNGISHINFATITGDDGGTTRPYPFSEDDSLSYYMVEFQMQIEHGSDCY